MGTSFKFFYLKKHKKFKNLKLFSKKKKNGWGKLKETNVAKKIKAKNKNKTKKHCQHARGHFSPNFFTSFSLLFSLHFGEIEF